MKRLVLGVLKCHTNRALKLIVDFQLPNQISAEYIPFDSGTKMDSRIELDGIYGYVLTMYEFYKGLFNQ